jgi:hypothetical protein
MVGTIAGRTPPTDAVVGEWYGRHADGSTSVIRINKHNVINTENAPEPLGTRRGPIEWDEGSLKVGWGGPFTKIEAPVEAWPHEVGPGLWRMTVSGVDHFKEDE